MARIMLEEELTMALGRGQYRRGGEAAVGYRHGTRHRQILGSFGPLEITVPRGRTPKPEGGTAEWRSAALPRPARAMDRGPLQPCRRAAKVHPDPRLPLNGRSSDPGSGRSVLLGAGVFAPVIRP
ncbi:transposase [Acidiphilium sp. C61]|uniref:transposase n=1 Tax=Acidiphilium sp. C61 TaxID=1671485 RepID=UPI00157B9FD9